MGLQALVVSTVVYYFNRDGGDRPQLDRLSPLVAFPTHLPPPLPVDGILPHPVAKTHRPKPNFTPGIP